MDTSSTTIRTVRTLAPEDIRIGDYVSVVSQTYQFPSFLWNDGIESQDGLVRVTYFPVEHLGEPLKVKAVCLPFIAARTATKKTRTLDIRQCQVARLADEYAAVLWKARKRKKK